MSKQGLITGELGKRLTDKFDALKTCDIYYDHGDKTPKNNVVACKGFIGNEVKNVNHLADIDLMIGNNNEEVVILVEIEERKSSPKKIIGDIFSIAMCDRIAILISKNKQKYYKITRKTMLFIGGIVPDNGSRKEKIDIIKERLKSFSGIDDSLCLNNIRLVFDKSIDPVIKNIETEIQKILTFSST